MLIIVKTADGIEGLCSGTVIGQRTVLTAAHCVAPQEVGRDASFSVFMGPDFRAMRGTPGLTLGVERTAFDPEFDPDLLRRGHDIGMLFTSAPLGRTPVPLGREPFSAQIPDVRVVGYGLSSATDVEGPTAGRRRQARIPVLGIRGALVDVGKADLGPCLGDSGGPALLQPSAGAQEILMGLVSYSPKDCDGYAVLTSVPAYLPLLDSWLAAEDQARNSMAGGCSMTGAQPMRSEGLGPWAGMMFCIGVLWCIRRVQRVIE